MTRIFAILVAAGAVAISATASADNTPADRMFVYAAETGDGATVMRMLDEGHPIDAQFEYHTALTMAASKNNLDLVRKLVARGAQVQSPRFVSALSDPARFGYLEMIRLLVESGADVNHRNTASAPAIWYASLYARDKAVEYLLSKGARVDVVHDLRRLPIQTQGGCRDPRTFKLLADAGSDLRHADDEGNTALHCATLNTPEVVAYALCKGADPKARNRDGRTALDEARRLKAIHSKGPRIALARFDRIIEILESGPGDCSAVRIPGTRR